MKTFDVGVYKFEKIVTGSYAKDDSKLNDGDIVGCLHPAYNHPIYAFGIHKESKNSVKLIKQNLHFKKVITLSYTPDPKEVEMHTKLNVLLNYLADETKQLEIL